MVIACEGLSRFQQNPGPQVMTSVDRDPANGKVATFKSDFDKCQQSRQAQEADSPVIVRTPPKPRMARGETPIRFDLLLAYAQGGTRFVERSEALRKIVLSDLLEAILLPSSTLAAWRRHELH